MTPQAFVSATDGVAVTYDGLQVNYGQCVQLVCLFWKDCYGFLCPPIPYAKDLITNPVVLESFEVIPVGQEQPWDVAVFGASAAINSPVAGHTDIVLNNVGAGGYIGWDSNWGGVTDKNVGTKGYGYPAAHQVNHTYSDVIGFLRWKGVSNMPPTASQVIVTYSLAFDCDDSQVPQSFITAYTKPGATIDGMLTQLHTDPTWLAHKAQVNAPSGYVAYTAPELYTKN